MEKKGFFKRYESSFSMMMMFLDLLAIIVAASFAHYIRFDSLGLSAEIDVAIFLCLLLTIVVFKSARVYKPFRGSLVSKELIRLTLAWGAVIGALTVFAYLTKSGAKISREWALYTIVFALFLMATSRYLINRYLQHMRRTGRNLKHALIIGASQHAQSVAEQLGDQTWAGVNLVAFYDKSFSGSQLNNLPVLKDMEDLEIQDNTLCISNKKIEQIWIVLPLGRIDEIRTCLNQFENLKAQVNLVPEWEDIEFLRQPRDEFAGIYMINMSAPKVVGPEAFVKTLFDKVFSFAVLLFLWPILLLIALAIKLESSGPVIFKQERYGLDGKKIEVWKFRSMRCTESGESAKQATKNDARVTKVGRFIRTSSLDELPQFINVLQGSMSVVGPRPHPTALDDEYMDKIRRFGHRHNMKPGITGWAQVNGWRGETDELYKMEERVKYDIEYINNWNFWLDLKIIALTIFKGFLGQNAY